jgi:hypothetical protein
MADSPMADSPMADTAIGRYRDVAAADPVLPRLALNLTLHAPHRRRNRILRLRALRRRGDDRHRHRDRNAVELVDVASDEADARTRLEGRRARGVAVERHDGGRRHREG